MTGLWAKYRYELADDPFMALALSAALFAASRRRPCCIAVLGRLGWFKPAADGSSSGPVFIDHRRHDAGGGESRHLRRGFL